MSDEALREEQAREALRTPGCVHDLKVWPEFYRALESGEKPFELRKDDRGFRVGHVLRLREWHRHSQSYSGREMTRTITYVLAGVGLADDYVVLGLSPVTREMQDAYLRTESDR